ncbi:MAG: hypothetical protein WKF80_07365, partial [Thermomicrobiales bacterium]
MTRRTTTRAGDRAKPAERGRREIAGPVAGGPVEVTDGAPGHGTEDGAADDDAVERDAAASRSGGRAGGAAPASGPGSFGQTL